MRYKEQQGCREKDKESDEHGSNHRAAYRYFPAARATHHNGRRWGRGQETTAAIIKFADARIVPTPNLVVKGSLTEWLPLLMCSQTPPEAMAGVAAPDMAAAIIAKPPPAVSHGRHD
jgi:hypothetical protein